MKRIYRHTERGFEQVASLVINILGNSITFIIALVVVVFWLSHRLFYAQDINDKISDVIQGITFLSLFIIQRAFKRFSALLHVKVNELIASHEPANNNVINMDTKTDHELREMLDGYAETTTPKKEV